MNKAQQVYWQVVEETLVKLFEVERSKAKERIKTLRKEYSKDPEVLKLMYYDTPFKVAAALSGQADEPSKSYAALYERYTRLVEELRLPDKLPLP